nr:hypothetical protein [Tanacetum cinerariifolium]
MIRNTSQKNFELILNLLSNATKINNPPQRSTNRHYPFKNMKAQDSRTKLQDLLEDQGRSTFEILIETRCRIDYFNGMSYDDICPIFEAMFNSNIEFLMKTKEQIEEEDNREITSINETPAQKAAKRRRLNKEAKNVEELKQHLEIVPDEDDDIPTLEVYTGTNAECSKSSSGRAE